ncbi:hypothetical protein [Nocardioides daphniae]|uniref:Uncharacterized protein n=1 Tax=Nocardioides daphniae TaxID=402297 RepID=A0A4V1CWT9_9ACTN|nr:hypothetical protein [Nocardioides daphniae]QCC78427.1 hypothetical protein E2C04_16715 [Nocardioides daphniae]
MSVLESFATHFTDETRVALWCAVVVVLAVTPWMARRVRRSPRPWVWVALGMTLVVVAVLAALLVPLYLESVDLEPL